MGLNICVYAICKNEAQFAKRWMASMQEADGIVVMDTGSTDDTVEILRSHGALAHTEAVSPWRFDEARNRSLAYVPEDVDICVATDLDDVWEPGWRALLEKAWQPGTTRASCLYNYSFLPDGRPANQNFYHSHIHARHGYRWTRAVHEYLTYVGTGQEQEVNVKGLVLNHYPDLSKSRKMNLEPTKIALREDPDDVEMIHCLGLGYFENELYFEAAEALIEYLGHPRGLDAGLRLLAMRVIAKCFEMQDEPDEAYRWYLRAIAEDSRFRDAYVELAMLSCNRNDWHTTLFAACKALDITDRHAKQGSANSWGYVPEHLASAAYSELGLPEKALAHAKRALALSPDLGQLRENVEKLERVLTDR